MALLWHVASGRKRDEWLAARSATACSPKPPAQLGNLLESLLEPRRSAGAKRAASSRAAQRRKLGDAAFKLRVAEQRRKLRAAAAAAYVPP